MSPYRPQKQCLNLRHGELNDRGEAGFNTNKSFQNLKSQYKINLPNFFTKYYHFVKKLKYFYVINNYYK